MRTLPILTAGQMQAVDKATFAHLAIESRCIMESAGRTVAEVILERYGAFAELGVVVVAGIGNNGGDGYVVARALLNLGVSVSVIATSPLELMKGDALKNAVSWAKLGGETVDYFVDDAAQERGRKLVEGSGVIVDAVFGTGFAGECSEDLSELLTFIQEASAQGRMAVVSIDIPSGVDATTGKVDGVALRSDTTVALQNLKLGHVLFPGADYCGEIVLADIGICGAEQGLQKANRFLVSAADVSSLFQSNFPVDSKAHKGVRGKVLVVGGSAGHYGAPKMSGQAALLVGAGLVSMLVPKHAAAELGPRLQELMCLSLEGDSGENFSGVGIEAVPGLVSGYDGVVLGPGIGQGDGAGRLVLGLIQALKSSSARAVIDADALNILAAQPESWRALGENFILTPHSGEMARLLGESVSEIEADRLRAAEKAAKWSSSWVVLKGARTVIASPRGECWINPAACSVLATAGSGDVLAGVVGALLARGMSVGDAAICAVFLHGGAGELLEQEQDGGIGVLASVIAEYVPKVISCLLNDTGRSKSFRQVVLPGSFALLSSGIKPGCGCCES